MEERDQVDIETRDVEREEKDREWDESDPFDRNPNLFVSLTSLEDDLDKIKGYKDMESYDIEESLKDVKKAQQILVEIKNVLFEKEIRKSKVKAEDYTQRFNALAESKEK